MTEATLDKIKETMSRAIRIEGSVIIADEELHHLSEGEEQAAITNRLGAIISPKVATCIAGAAGWFYWRKAPLHQKGMARECSSEVFVVNYKDWHEMAEAVRTLDVALRMRMPELRD